MDFGAGGVPNNAQLVEASERPGDPHAGYAK
jgi:hypothetical protein